MKYEVTGLVMCACTTIVEAKNKTQAKKLAKERGLAELCHRPFIEDHDEAFYIELEGDIKKLDVEQYFDGDDS
tara:strand:- start:258 stop:476 length:219 start_codon:yes stop_codon:yes gene_type:complete